MVVLLFLLVTVVAFGVGYRVASVRHASRVPPLALPAPAPSRGELAAGSGEAAPPSRVRYEAQAVTGSPEWDVAMRDVGEQMRRAGVRLVVFAHGSFVGDDPLGLARLVEDAAPALPELARGLRQMTRTNAHRLLGDLSNFTDEYVTDFARATGVAATSFTWSSENHHAARIQGAARLARSVVLHGGGAVRPGDRVLLVGHSHAGQIFALLSQLVAGTYGHEELLAAAQARGEDVGALREHLDLLRRCDVDAVTFGTPPRYGWAKASRFRPLHVVNHRGAAPRAPSLRGFFHTKHGDYVHQIGVHGSDFPAPTSRERAINERLDRWLGEGSGVRTWLRHVAGGLRIAPHGHTVLVDYGDGAGAIPNFWATGFGHAAYTRRDAMLFHARLVATHFYPPRAESAPGSWVERLRALRAPRVLALPPRRSPSSPESPGAPEA